jgi:hypothetical protein
MDVGLGGHRPTHLGARASEWGTRPSQLECLFHNTRYLLQTEILLNFVSCSCGWSKMIPHVKKLDVEVLGWRDYMWSVVARPVGRTA